MLLKAAALAAAFATADALCPYANLWMKYGVDDATKILEHLSDKKKAAKRRLIESTNGDNVFAKCEYVNPFAQLKTCVHLEGDGWGVNNATNHCKKNMMGGMAEGKLTVGAKCENEMNNPKFGGYCIIAVGGKTEASLMMLGGMSPTCESLEQSCSTWSQGTFKFAGACAPEGNKSTNGSGNTLDPGFGACEYKEPWGSTDQCVQLSGSGWNADNAATYCSSVMNGMAAGKVTTGKVCETFSHEKYGGYCLVNDGDLAEKMPMMLTPPMMGTCEAMENSCATWYNGKFVKGGSCGSEETNGEDHSSHSMVYSDDDEIKQAPAVPRCSIAPGPIGGAHQNAGSPGYDKDCADAPGKNSPYQWPLMWSAIQKTNSFYADKRGPGYSSTSRVYYNLDKNYKRMDTIEFDGTMAQMEWFDYDDVDKQSILHRGSEMVFITTYKNETTTCSKMDLGVVGNIRPDWFLDDRGTLTSVQYLGNEHVYYQNEPTLVKKWRKKDFADMYFVVSIAAEADENGVHWPLIRNDPGEGIGPDALHEYTDHRIMNEDEADDIFFIDKGMDCPIVESGGGGGGFSDFMKEEIPSNLNVDEAGWFNLVWTGSPEGPELPPPVENCGAEESGAKPAGARPGVLPLKLTEGEIHYCHQDGDLRVKMVFATEEPVWASVAVRPSEMCRMTPADATIVHEKAPGDGMDYFFGDLPTSLRMNHNALMEADTVSRRNPDDVEMVGHSFEDGMMTFEFQRSMKELEITDPKLAHINWAIGMSSTMGYHKHRACDKFEYIPACSSVDFGAPKPEAEAEVPTNGDHGEHCSLDKQIADLQEGMKKLLCGQQDSEDRCGAMDGCEWHADHSMCSSL